MIRIIIILIIIFLLKNFCIKEQFSNGYLDSGMLSKLTIHGTNMSEEKPLLTLYFNRNEPNCKYFYDYFSYNYGSISPTESPLRFQDDEQYSGKKQPWNQLKELYVADTDALINPTFLNIEEIEVDEYNFADFNNLPAHNISNKKDAKQYYRQEDFLEKLPFVTLSFFKHKDKNEIDDIITQNKKIYDAKKAEAPVDSYSEETLDYMYKKLQTIQKSNLYTIRYEGLYSPNNRVIKTAYNNLITFIEKTFKEYLYTNSEPSHINRIGDEWGSNHTFTDQTTLKKCSKCSEYTKFN